MDISINLLLSTVILVAFVVTLVLAIGSYFAYKARERRRPRQALVEGDAPIFFERVFPSGRADRGAAGGDDGRAGDVPR